MQSTDLHVINQALERIATALESHPRICPSNWEQATGPAAHPFLSRNRYTCRDCGKVIDLDLWDQPVGLSMLATMHSIQHFRFD